MENRPLLEGPAPDPHGRKNGENHLLARPQYIEVPSSAVVEEPGPGLLLEYWDILRRHKGTLILIAFLGFLTSISAHASADTGLPGACLSGDSKYQ